MTIDITTLKTNLKKAGCDFSLAFVHGVLTASCCHQTDDEDWGTVLFAKPLATIEQMTALKDLSILKDNLTKQLSDNELRFDLLLDSHLPVAQQALQTREWISGFLLGIKRNKLIITDMISKEFLSDLTRLVAMPIPEIETEENLADLVEIQTYCQIGVITLYLTHTQPQ